MLLSGLGGKGFIFWLGRLTYPKLKQVKLWFYKLPPAGWAAVRKIQNGTIQEKNRTKLIC